MATDYSPWSAEYGFKTSAEPVDPPGEIPPGQGETRLDKIWHSESFQSVPLGANPRDSTMASNCSSARAVSSPAAPGGTRSIRTTVDEGGNSQGDGSWGRWGFTYEQARNGAPAFPEGGEGDELWTRLYFYVPSDFDWNNNKHVKFWRVRKKDSGGGNNGYFDMYVENHNAEWKSHTEADEDYPTPAWFPTGVKVPSGRWFCYEQYIKFGKDNGVRKFWLDGELFQEYTHGHTQKNGVKFFANYVLTYWDEKLPKTQSLYFAHYAVAFRGNGRDDRVYMDRDSSGFPMIGLKT